MSTRVGINGFGRIGRNLLRAASEAIVPLAVAMAKEDGAELVIAHFEEQVMSRTSRSWSFQGPLSRSKRRAARA